MKKTQKSKVKNAILSIALALLFVFFIYQAIQLVYPAPQYEYYCQDYRTAKFIDNQVQCEAENGTWQNSYCDLFYSCNQQYEDARLPYENNLFYINMAIGVIMFTLAFLVFEGIISVAFTLGSAIMLVYASIRHWNELSDIWRTIVLGIGVAVLTWIGYRESKKK